MREDRSGPVGMQAMELDLVMVMRQTARYQDEIAELKLQVNTLTEMFEAFRQQHAPTAPVLRDPNTRPPSPVPRSPTVPPPPQPAPTPPASAPSATPPPTTPGTPAFQLSTTPSPPPPERASREYSVPPPSPPRHSPPAVPASPLASQEHGGSANVDIHMDDGPDVGPIVNDVGLEASTTPVTTVTPPATGVHMDGGSNVGPIISDVGPEVSTPVVAGTPPADGVPTMGTVAMDGNDMHVD